MDVSPDINYAELHYEDGTVTITKYGTHVVCAITGKSILLEELCYWSVARQEPYFDATAALEAWRRHDVS